MNSSNGDTVVQEEGGLYLCHFPKCAMIRAALLKQGQSGGFALVSSYESILKKGEPVALGYDIY